jgi:hypothetical protein
MRIPRPKLPALFTQSPFGESTEEDSIDDRLASHRALFTDAVYETDLIDGSATEINDPWVRDLTSFLSGTYPYQGVDYILLANTDIKISPLDYGTHTSSANATEIWTRYPENAAHAYIYLNHPIAPVRPDVASVAATSSADHTMNNLMHSAIQTVLQQLDKTTLDAAQAKRENAVLRATIARYEQENEDLEDTIRTLMKVHNSERRLCMCVHNLDQPRPQDRTTRYGECRFVEGRIPSWERKLEDWDWLGEDGELGA